MKRIATAVAIVILGAITAQAQERTQRRPHSPTASGNPQMGMSYLLSLLEELEEAVVAQTTALTRDAFIVTRLVAAVGALNDFQIGAAVQKAIDEVDAAQQRAKQKPTASADTVEMLDTVSSLLESAQRQGTLANLPSIQREILTRLEPLQRTMFVRLDDMRKLRVAISDMQTRLAKWNDTIDVAMTEALGASLDYTRTGGK